MFKKAGIYYASAILSEVSLVGVEINFENKVMDIYLPKNMEEIFFSESKIQTLSDLFLVLKSTLLKPLNG